MTSAETKPVKTESRNPIENSSIPSRYLSRKRTHAKPIAKMGARYKTIYKSEKEFPNKKVRTIRRRNINKPEKKPVIIPTIQKYFFLYILFLISFAMGANLTNDLIRWVKIH